LSLLSFFRWSRLRLFSCLFPPFFLLLPFRVTAAFLPLRCNSPFTLSSRPRDRRKICLVLFYPPAYISNHRTHLIHVCSVLPFTCARLIRFFRALVGNSLFLIISCFFLESGTAHSSQLFFAPCAFSEVSMETLF